MVMLIFVDVFHFVDRKKCLFFDNRKSSGSFVKKSIFDSVCVTHSEFVTWMDLYVQYEPGREKTGLWGFWPDLTQTGWTITEES